MAVELLVEAYGRGVTVVPVVGDGVSAMSAARQAGLLSGYDPVVVLEAASTVLADIERERGREIVARLPPADRRSIETWRARVRDATPAPVPTPPLAVLAATTLALGQSSPGPRSDEVREQVAGRLTEVALRLNGPIVGDTGGDDAVLAYMCRNALWKAVEDQDWMIWSGELIAALEHDPSAVAIQAAFVAAANVTITEWWYRGLGERSTRAAHGARSWGGAEGVDPELEADWIRLVSSTVDDAVNAAQRALDRPRRNNAPIVGDPFDLSWLASRPIVVAPDGRRFQMWIGANNRCLLPAGIAQTVAEVAKTPYGAVAERLGRAAEGLLSQRVASVPDVANEVRIPESSMPDELSKCDYLIEVDQTLCGLEFTMATPTRALSAGQPPAVRDLTAKFADKFEQAYSAFEWRDPTGTRRWLPVLILCSPTVVDPLLNERVHELLVERGVLPTSAESELMTCHAPEFLDFLQFCENSGLSPAEGIRRWRDSPLRGSALEWWLADQGALRSSGRRRIEAVTDRTAQVLGRVAT